MRHTIHRLVFMLYVVSVASGCKKSISSFQITSANGKEINLKIIFENKATVFVFLDPDCPLSQNYISTLNHLNSRFENSKIKFYGVVPGSGNTAMAVNAFVSNYKINYEVLLDDKLILTRYFDAAKTPEVFVIDIVENIIYSGAIDNWAVDLGKKRTVITSRYLQDALEAKNRNTEIKIKRTNAVGCIIER